MTTAKVFRTCPECGLRFERKHHRAEFCTPAHSRAYNNRHTGEGQRIVGLAKAWRMGRNTSDPELKAASKEAFTQLCRELDVLIQNDAAQGRMSALKVYRRRKNLGLLDYQGPLS